MISLFARFFGVVASSALVGALAFAGTAQAGPPLENEHLRVTDSHIEQEAHEDFCPDLDFLVLWEGEAKLFFFANTHGDGFVYFADHIQFTDVYTNLTTGKTLTIKTVAANKDFQIEDNGDGTITITVASRGSTHVYDSAGQLLFRDAGLTRFQFVVDTAGTPGDPSDDVFVEDLGVTKMAGHFETFDRDFCADLQEFTT